MAEPTEPKTGDRAADLIEVRIEPMTEEDLPEVLAIEAQSFPTPWSRELFLHEIRYNAMAHALVARTADPELGRSILGYVCLWLVVDEAHITNIAVHPKARRRGIAKQIMIHTLRMVRAKGFKVATLEVRVSNHAAKQMYEDLGFLTVGIRKGYYTDTREDALVMVLPDLEEYR